MNLQIQCFQMEILHLDKNMNNFNTKEFLLALRQTLTKTGSEKDRIAGQRFFKHSVLLYGIKSKVVTEIANQFYKTELSELPKSNIFLLCEELFSSQWLEESFLACNWSLQHKKNYQIEDFDLFEQWINLYVKNWATCDTFCNHNVMELIIKFPNLINRLKEWANSPNLWMRRAAAVTLIIPARRGKFLDDIFEIATTMLLDKEDMVQKGYGWMLKAASNAHLEQVFQFVMQNKAIMPRTALRYAIEKMPENYRKAAMAK